MSVFVWSMVGIAIWHFTVFVPDRFWGGIIGAFLAACAGALLTGYLLPEPGVPRRNPPGVGEALWAIPGGLAGLAASYAYGAWRSTSQPRGAGMRLFKRRKSVTVLPCPECSQLLPVDATKCDMCGADLRERDPSQPAPEPSEAPR